MNQKHIVLQQLDARIEFFQNALRDEHGCSHPFHPVEQHPQICKTCLWSSVDDAAVLLSGQTNREELSRETQTLLKLKELVEEGVVDNVVFMVGDAGFYLRPSSALGPTETRIC